MRASYSLPDEQCERLTRSEMQALQMLMAATSISLYAKDDLKRRVDSIPNGKKRMQMSVGGLRSVLDDIIGTITVQQAKHLRNVMTDYELRLVPKLTPITTNIVLSKEEAKFLMDSARAKCYGCVEDNNECKKCRLYKLMETLVPLERYEGLICPYSLAEWEE